MKPNHVEQADTIQFRRILLATDFSDASLNALRYATAIARNHGAKLYIVHVVSSVGYRMVGADAEIRGAELAQRDLQELWSRLEGGDPSSPVEPALIVRRGDVHHELEDVIRKEHIDLVVVGTRGRTGLSKVMLGSVAECVFRKVRCAVLTVGPSSDWDWPQREVGAEKAILFATDFGEASFKALPYAVSIANRSRSKLFLLHVADFVAHATQTPVSGNTLEVAEQASRESSRKRLEELLSNGLRIDHEVLVAFGPPIDGILKGAASTAAGLIVLGLHRTILLVPSGHLPSTTAYGVVLGAQCPVLTVRS